MATPSQLQKRSRNENDQSDLAAQTATKRQKKMRSSGKPLRRSARHKDKVVEAWISYFIPSQVGKVFTTGLDIFIRVLKWSKSIAPWYMQNCGFIGSIMYCLTSSMKDYQEVAVLASMKTIYLTIGK